MELHFVSPWTAFIFFSEPASILIITTAQTGFVDFGIGENTMNKKWIIVGGLAALTAAAVHTAPVVAEARGLIDGGQRLAHVRALVGELNLTDTQKEQIRGIVAKAAPEVQPIVKEMERNHLALRAATENHYDAARVRVIADKQGKLVSELTVVGARTKAQIFGVLTTAQQAKAESGETRIEELVAGVHYQDVLNAVLQ